MKRKGHIDPELVIGREGAGGEKGPAQSHDCCRMAIANIRRYADPKLGWYLAWALGEMTITHCPWCGEKLEVD